MGPDQHWMMSANVTFFPNYEMNYGALANHSQSLNKTVLADTSLFCQKTQVFCF
jgi:hypothetical protein